MEGQIMKKALEYLLHMVHENVSDVPFQSSILGWG